MKLTEKDKRLARKGFETLNDDALRTRAQNIENAAVGKAKVKSRRKDVLQETFPETRQQKIESAEMAVKLVKSANAAAREKITGIPQKKSSVVTLLLNDSARIELPQPAVKILRQTLKFLAEGREVSVTAQPAELTTQQAADFLRVSRPFLVGLLEKGEMPFHKVGTHRRIGFGDLQAYKETIDARRLSALEELTKQAQELNMGY